jgi:ketosteroid isomerase-like protein
METNAQRTRNLQLLRQLYQGLEAGDLEAITSTFSPSVVVHIRGAGELDGTFRGLADVRSLYRQVIVIVGPEFKVPPYEVLVHDETLVVVPQGSAFGDAERGLDVYHLDGERFTEVWLTAWPSRGP